MRPCHTTKQTITNCRGRHTRRPAVTDKLPGTMCRERRLAVPRLLAICTAGEGTPRAAFPTEFGSCLSYRNQRADNIRPYGSFLDCCIVMVRDVGDAVPYKLSVPVIKMAALKKRAAKGSPSIIITCSAYMRPLQRQPSCQRPLQG